MNCARTQGFGANANSSYEEDGLKGHTGIDISCGYGSEIECPVDGYVYKVLDDTRKANDGSGYWGLFILSEWQGKPIEFQIGHCSKFFVDVGATVVKGQIVGLEGNRGRVYAGGIQITPVMQRAGDRRGSHRHLQARLLEKTSYPKYPNNLTQYAGGLIYSDKDSKVYGIPTYNNGYNGCFDCSPILASFESWKVVASSTPTPPQNPPESQEIPPIIAGQISTILETIKRILMILLKGYHKP